MAVAGTRHLKLEFFVASLVAKNLDVVPFDVATMQAGIGTEKSADAVMIDVGVADLVVAALPMMTAATGSVGHLKYLLAAPSTAAGAAAQVNLTAEELKLAAAAAAAAAAAVAVKTLVEVWKAVVAVVV
ncbi:hypothetical protein BHM03_00033916 [Ensete ventricosum]|nr:hypothetical protein BHM03_00033916 [Ensete ventricosum]